MYWKTSLGLDESWETSHGASGKSRVPLLKIPKGALTHHRPEAGGGSPCGARALSEGDCDLCGDRQPMSPCLRARRASAARLTHITQADSDQHGKYADGMISMPVNRVCKPATGSFAGVWMPAGIQSLLFFEREAEKRLCGAGKVKENGDGTATVTFSIPDTASFPTDRIGEYSVTVSGNKGTASWSKDGMSTSGGLSAEAYGTEQLQLLSYDYAGTMWKLRDMGIMPSPTENVVKPNPRLTSGDIEWTEEDQAEADRALAEAKAEDDERLAKIAKAESEGSLTMERASAMGKDAVIQEYRLTEEQTNKLNYEPDSTYISYQNDQLLAHMLFWLWQKDGDTFTEKDGQYWVTIQSTA